MIKTTGVETPYPCPPDQVWKITPQDQIVEAPTLRDQFAMAALTGLVFGRKDNVNTFAEEAYKIADAMLKAREEKYNE